MMGRLCLIGALILVVTVAVGCVADGTGTSTRTTRVTDYDFPATLVGPPPVPPPPTTPLRRSQEALVIETEFGSAHLTVEMASQPSDLAFSAALAPNAGMLFVYPDSPYPVPETLLVMNVPIPLDMIFMKRNGTIFRIDASRKLLSEELIASGEPVDAVLMIGGGRAAELGVQVGHKVSGVIFAPRAPY